MRPLKYAGFLFYRYYSGGRRPDSSPYFRTICSQSFLAFMHLFQILILLDRVDFISIKSSDDKTTNRLVMFLFFVPIYFLMTMLVKKKELDKMKDEYSGSWDKVFKWNVWLIVYIILSFSIIILLAFLKR